MTTYPTKEPNSAVLALQDALSAEHAAIWAYDLATAFLSEASAKAISDGASGEHRARRATTQRLITDRGDQPAAARPHYRTPVPVTDQPSAIKLLITVETDAQIAWRSALERSHDSHLRNTALDGLLYSSVLATRWRLTIGQNPATEPFPGDPRATP